MTPPLQTVECTLPGRRGHRGHRQPTNDHSPQPQAPLPLGRVPRLSRLMALALRFEQLLREGVIADYAALARLGHVSRGRVSQIMNLLLLSPQIQEQILFLPRVESGRDPIHLSQLQPLAATLDWPRQRRMWHQLQRCSSQ